MDDREKRERQKAIRDGHAELRALRGEGDKARRLPLSEIVRLLLERPQRATTAEVELVWNAKGDTQVKVSVPTSEELPTIRDAANEAQAVYDALREAYPRGPV